jgi:hypothetical protein
LNFCAISTARADFPEAVGPTMTIILGRIFMLQILNKSPAISSRVNYYTTKLNLF